MDEGEGKYNDEDMGGGEDEGECKDGVMGEGEVKCMGRDAGG
jgi:hypothetical protein